jgi:protein-S-isoprenylcysteine O-methyltransferase Ste14
MNESQKGWAFVGAQFVLLALVILLPTGDDWGRPGWLRGISLIINVAGLVLFVFGVKGLGRSLTATPVPLEGGRLQTAGLYGLMRHPIYTSVIVIIVGISIGSGSILRAAIAVATIVFFNVKARWEERRLAQRYPDYRSYASVVPRFVPRLPRP